MGRRRQSDGGAGFGVFLAVALIIAVIVKYFWWIAGAAALVGAYFAVRAILRKVEQRRLEAAEREAELARRAEQQHRWTLRGDSRGVYGPRGAQAMRSVSTGPPDVGAADDVLGEIAAVTYNAENLDRLIREKLTALIESPQVCSLNFLTCEQGSV